VTADPTNADPLIEPQPSRFVVGIDLGTTNSAVCYVDTSESPWQVRTFAVPQVVAAHVVESRQTLPSFHYEPAEGEFAGEALATPWQSGGTDYTVGFLARDHGALVPGRLIASAKSWLCHTGVDRTAELLPWQTDADVERLSPLEVSARYLKHIATAWDWRFPEQALADQDIVLTLPASFDEIAREFTVQAAARAGLKRVVLIEEPQAAFYAWLHAHEDSWQDRVDEGQKILVCDIGGGTTDLTLIRVRLGPDGRLQFHRVAVGDHLILGGDNLDLALAHHLEGRVAGSGRLAPRQWEVLVRQCRQAKETLLSDGAPDRVTVTLPGRGSKLIGGASAEAARAEVQQLILDGFFPRVPLDAKPESRQSGFQEFGLPFAPDPAVTKYLAAFLTAHRRAGLEEDESDADVSPNRDPARPDVVLFNGAVFFSADIRQRMLDVIADWFPAAPEDGADEPVGESDTTTTTWRPIELHNDRLDLAVARGAAYYGMVRRGDGVKIAAGLARTYYVGVEGEDGQTVCLCLVPGRAEPGEDIELTDREFQLLVSQPVEFPLSVSSTRLTDVPGQAVPFDREQMTVLAPIRTALQTRKRGEQAAIAVHLHARLTEIGTLQLWCREVQGERSWRLDFDVRSATQTDVAVHEGSAEQQGFLDETTWNDCRAVLEATYGREGSAKPPALVRQLAEALGAPRHEWPTSLCRRIWDTLIELESGRQRSPGHEQRWLNLLGYCLRPGYGLAMDDWRVTETWRLLYGKLIHPSPACRAESRILWRRIAGGLSRGQQRALANPVLAGVRGLHHQLTTGRGRGGDFTFPTHEAAEIWRMLGSLELLDVRLKVELGNILLDLLPKKKIQPVRLAVVWAIGRLGARVPLYGPLNTVLPADVVGPWLPRLIKRLGNDPIDRLTVMQLSRRTPDRYRNLAEETRRLAADWLEDNRAPAHYAELVQQGGTLDSEEQGQVFGESLPSGLRLT